MTPLAVAALCLALVPAAVSTPETRGLGSADETPPAVHVEIQPAQAGEPPETGGPEA